MDFEIDEVLLSGSDDHILDYLDESDDVILIDWGEEESDIVNYFDALLEGELTSDFEDGDLIIQYEGNQARARLQMNSGDRYRTIRCIRDLIGKNYEIRVFADTLETDTHALFVKSKTWWRWVHGQFPERMDYLFVKLTDDLDFE